MVQVKSIEEAQVHIESLTTRVELLEQQFRDHAERFDTLQTPFYKRIWYAIQGWPWYDLNGQKAWRPWDSTFPIKWGRLD